MTSEALMTSGGNKYHSLIVLGGGVTGLSQQPYSVIWERKLRSLKYRII